MQFPLNPPGVMGFKYGPGPGPGPCAGPGPGPVWTQLYQVNTDTVKKTAELTKFCLIQMNEAATPAGSWLNAG